MKKLFTLLAFMTCFLGAKAANWVEVYDPGYSKLTGFPYFVMGYVPEWFDGVMTDFGANYRYATQDVLDNGDAQGNGKLTDEESIAGSAMAGTTEYQRVTGAGPYWHQYFIADGIPTQLDGHYKVVALVKASEDVSININMQWNWSGGVVSASVPIPAGDDFAEVEWEYSGIAGTSCALIAQPGTFAGTIEWKSLKVYEDQKAQKPVVWQQWLTDDGKSIIPGVETESKYMGDAEFGAWPSWALEETDGVNTNWRGDRTGEICAWALTMGKNYQESVINEDSPRARPFPADIVADPSDESNHVFAVDVTQIAAIDAPTPDENSIAWSNQFWIQAPKAFKSGEQVRIKFRYKAEHACSAATQIHKQHPSDYLHWNAVGDVNFTTEWQEFDKTITFDENQGGGWSLAFNLCSDAENGRTPNVFYFDDLSWETMVLEEGLFVASANTTTGLEYDFDNAVPFEWDAELAAYVATAGEVGNQDSWVNELMISTIAGNDAAFKGSTISPSGSYIGEDEWGEYTAKSLSKIKLPAAGVWKIAVDTDSKQINIVQLEGEAPKDPVDIVTNATEVVVHGLERDDIKDDDHPNGTGAAWDNQLFIIANRTLAAGEVTVLKFKYKASKEAKTSTQCHVLPGQYKHWGAIGEVNFTTDWQEFSQIYTVPADADGMQSIAFNMAEIKEACDYEIKDVQWYLQYTVEGKTMENLIDAEGTKNFYVKEGAGTDPYEFGTSGISTIVVNTNANNAIYNIAGQRVNNSFKGIVVKNGNKYVVK
jgi:hypothetical protein